MAELEKLMQLHEVSQKIGEFLEWLRSEKHYVISEWTDVDTLQPVGRSIENLLAEYFNINLAQVEDEKMAILNDIRKRMRKEEAKK